jgi:capsular polysaccharide biosynthesis protein
MNLIFTPPSLEDIIRLLKAWRFWVLGAIVGALIGTAAYYIVPPPYRAKATVNVDFNLEEALPKDTDRQHFYYLERESRKMEELAWSDEIISQLSSQFAITNDELRGSVLQLSQPAEAGWHFYADNSNAQTAEEIATVWANAFVEKIQSEIKAGNINKFIKLEVTQSKGLLKERSIPLSGYILSGALGFLTLAVFVLLFVKPKTESNVS